MSKINTFLLISICLLTIDMYDTIIMFNLWKNNTVKLYHLSILYIPDGYI